MIKEAIFNFRKLSYVCIATIFSRKKVLTLYFKDLSDLQILIILKAFLNLEFLEQDLCAAKISWISISTFQNKMIQFKYLVEYCFEFLTKFVSHFHISFLLLYCKMTFQHWSSMIRPVICTYTNYQVVLLLLRFKKKSIWVSHDFASL